MRIIPIRVVMAAALSLAAVGGCAGSDDSAGKTTVVAAFFPLAELAHRVGGDLVEVTTLTPPGVEPHDLELSTGQVGRATEADVLLYLGGGFQPAVTDLAERARGRTVDLLQGLPLVDDDPHVWLDPSFMSRMSVAVQGVLARSDPAHRIAFTENAARYREELAAVDRRFQAGLADCDRNVVVTSHAAYRYLTSRYGLEQEAATGADPDAEPAPGRMAELATLIRDGGVTTVFAEPLVRGGPAAALARETGVETAVLDPIEGPPKDAPEATWADLMRRNLASLRAALDCR